MSALRSFFCCVFFNNNWVNNEVIYLRALPFCARVRFVGRELGVAFEEVIVRYDDDATLINLVGKRAVPLLVKNDGQVMAESNDIIDYYFSLAGSTAISDALEGTLA